MKKTVSMEVPEDRVKLVERVLALQDEMEALALSAPHGRVLDDCEAALVAKGPQIEADVLARAVAARIAEVEKKGRRSGAARAAAAATTADAKPASS